MASSADANRLFATVWHRGHKTCPPVQRCRRKQKGREEEKMMLCIHTHPHSSTLAPCSSAGLPFRAWEQVGPRGGCVGACRCLAEAARSARLDTLTELPAPRHLTWNCNPEGGTAYLRYGILNINLKAVGAPQDGPVPSWVAYSAAVLKLESSVE